MPHQALSSTLNTYLYLILIIAAAIHEQCYFFNNLPTPSYMKTGIDSLSDHQFQGTPF